MDGEETLVDVARLGMIAMYYRTPEGTYGQAIPDGDSWSWSPVTGSEDAMQVADLFDALSQGIRVGAFTLPNPLAGAR